MAMVKAVLVAVVAVAALAQLATAVDHPVGGSGVKWSTSGGYDAWSGAQKFTTKDSLVFDYSSSHDVVEVSKAGYDACSASGAVATYNGGKTTIKLTTAGKRYFICGIPGHCAAGMKLAVNVVAATATPATPAKPRGQRSVAPVAAPAPAPAPVESSTDEQQPNVSAPTGSTPSSAATIGAKAAVAIAMGMAVVFAM